MSRPEAKVGPGHLIPVVGPSGAGKDTLIRRARERCRNDPRIVFVRRTVTRPPSIHEDHDCLEQTAFDAAVRRGAFAFWWSAHGLCYGLPRSMDVAIREGRTVVCNVSRTIVGDLRARYRHVTVILVTAPEAVRLARMTARARVSDGDIALRQRREGEVGELLNPDVVIENVADPEEGAETMLKVILGAGLRNGGASSSELHPRESRPDDGS